MWCSFLDSKLGGESSTTPSYMEVLERRYVTFASAQRSRWYKFYHGSIDRVMINPAVVFVA